MSASTDRRKFLSDCGKMTGIGAMSCLLNLAMTNKVLAARSAGSVTDYKGLVCVFLGGGNDSANLLAPGVDNYETFLATRGILANAANPNFNIVDTADGDDYHVHASMAGVRNMFQAGELGFVANVGTLHEPMTMDEFRNGGKKRPFGLFSHFDQSVQWQNSLPRVRGGSLAGQGWVGRMTEVLRDAANNNATVNTNMAPGGNNTLQTSRTSRPLSLREGANGLDKYIENINVRKVIDEDLEVQYANILQSHYNHVRKENIINNNELVEIEANTSLNTVFPTSSVGIQLSRVATYIKAQGTLGANRQTFFVKDGGYDMHKGVTTRHGGKMSGLSAALNAFNEAMKEIGYHDRVVTYTASDFGRSLASNGTGSDHGWGSNQIVMGGPVNGGRIFGQYPDIALGSATDVGRGRQLPTTSVDQLHASLGQWFGIQNDNEMEIILPNIRNFWDANASSQAIPELFNPALI